MEPIWTKIFIKQTYSCIKNRGIHNVAHDLKTALIEHPEETTYCLKMDVRKFYPSLTRYSFPVNFKIRPYVRTKKNRNGCAARLNREIR